MSVFIGLMLFASAWWWVGFDPFAMKGGGGMVMTLVGKLASPSPGSAEHLATILSAFWQTIAIALLGTVLGTAIGSVLAPLSSRTLSGWALGLITRRLMDGVRSIDMLIWALIWVSVVGLGPLAGVLAIATVDVAAYSRMLSDALEDADPRQVELLRSLGAKRTQQWRYGMLPQIFPVATGQILYVLEGNLRGSAIIGIVGAGGLGAILSESIRTFEWEQVSFTLLVMLAMVAGISTFGSMLRRALS